MKSQTGNSPNKLARRIVWLFIVVTLVPIIATLLVSYGYVSDRFLPHIVLLSVLMIVFVSIYQVAIHPWIISQMGVENTLAHVVTGNIIVFFITLIFTFLMVRKLRRSSD